MNIEQKIVISKENPADEIRRIALKKKIDMVITATHGKSGIKRLWIGSVTEKLMKTSDYIEGTPGGYINWRNPDYFEILKKVTANNREKINKLRSRLERQLYFMLPEEFRSWCTPHNHPAYRGTL